MAVALVVAAGRGERLGTPVPKAFVNLAGRPMVEWSVAALQDVAAVTGIVVALPSGVAAPAGTIGVPGGSERSHSVRAALAAAGPDDVVVVHDAARPLVTPALIAGVHRRPRGRRCGDRGHAGHRHDQGVRGRARRAHARPLAPVGRADAPGLPPRRARARARPGRPRGGAATDDAALVEALGATVRIVPASPENFKVTTALDLRVAEMLLRERSLRTSPMTAAAPRLARSLRSERSNVRLCCATSTPACSPPRC